MLSQTVNRNSNMERISYLEELQNGKIRLIEDMKQAHHKVIRQMFVISLPSFFLISLFLDNIPRQCYYIYEYYIRIFINIVQKGEKQTCHQSQCFQILTKRIFAKG